MPNDGDAPSGAGAQAGISAPASESSHAVFISYASEDIAAAERIATALSSAGAEVWFDKSELRGGDAWDHRIREQIHNCRLFIPVISANSERRDEGYFRREWALAADRTRDMAHKRAFLVPVVIDGTSERGASVPEKFHELQWTRLPGGETPPAFVERIKRLLSPENSPASDHAHTASSAVAGIAPAPRGLSRGRAGVLYGAIAATGLMALGYLGFERLNRSKPVAPGTASIAVLPLANESGDAGQQYFSDGLSEDLITALSQFPGLKVIGRTSSFQFRDSKDDSKTIGAKLGVAHLLEGSVRKAGDMVRVSAELIDASDGSTQWSERYDRPYKDLFALQDDITRAVAGALKTRLVLGANASQQNDRPPSGNLEAYNAVLEGEHYLTRRTEPDTRKAIERFTHATQVDPRYAFAWSQLSQAYTYLGAYYLDVAPAAEAYAQARAAVNTALEQAPDLVSAHIARASLFGNADLDWHGAEAEYRRALDLMPGNGDAKAGLGQALATLGQVEKAIELTRAALADDPLQGHWWSWLASYYLTLNRLDEAEQAIRKAIELQPAAVGWHTWLTSIEIRRGDAAAALASAHQEMPGEYWQDVALAMARQIGDDRAAADVALKTLIDKDATSAAYQVAQVYAIRKDADKTFEWLERAWSNRDPGIGFLLYDPFILHYKDDPRFAAFCRKVGLPTPAEVARPT